MQVLHRNGILLALGTLLAIPAAAFAQGAATSLTIYNDGRVLMRRTFPVEVSSGESTVNLGPGRVDPGTLFSLDPDVVIIGTDYEELSSAEIAVRRAIGHELRFGMKEDTITATVLGVDPLRLRLEDGSVIFSSPGTPLFPADLVGEGPLLVLNLRSDESRSTLPLGYFTSGASWQASYEVILADDDARVQGSAVIPSEGLNVEDAEIQLLAGAVSRAGKGSGPPRPMRVEYAEAAAQDMATEQRAGEFHLYTIPGTLTLRPGQTTTAALFAPARVPYEKRYVVRGVLPRYGMVQQWGEEEQEVPVEVTYTLEREQEGEFGKIPLPGGVARLYQADAQGRLQLVGESDLNHTAAGQEVRLDAGNAFDITARRVETSYELVRPSRTQTQVTAGYRVTVANATDSAVEVDVLEQRFGDWTVLESSVPAEKVSSTTTRFTVSVPAEGETVLTYRIRATW